jgi:hypothetical protein
MRFNHLRENISIYMKDLFNKENLGIIKMTNKWTNQKGKMGFHLSLRN